jgi:hypothetical protein
LKKRKGDRERRGVADEPILIGATRTPFSFCTMHKHDACVYKNHIYHPDTAAYMRYSSPETVIVEK